MSRRLRGLAITTLLLLGGCGERPPAHAAAPVALPRFENPAATRILVGIFPSPEAADLADVVPMLVMSELHRYESMAPIAAGSSARPLEIKRLFVDAESHQEAHALLARFGADLLVWGSVTCKGALDPRTLQVAHAAMCLHITIAPALGDRGTSADKGLDLERLTDFDLPAMELPGRVGLARFLVGVHFHGDARYLLAERALADATVLVAADQREHAWIDAYLAQAEMNVDHRRAAEALAAAALLKPNEKDGAVESALNATIGDARMKEHDPKGALGCYWRSLLVAEKALAEGHPHLAAVENQIGHALAELDDHAGALAHFRRARTLDESVVAADHLDLANDWENIGSQLALTKDAGAQEALERAEVIYRAKTGADGADVARVEEWKGLAFDGTGDLAQAVEHYRLSLSYFDGHPGLAEKDLIVLLNNLADSLSRQGAHADALIALQRALAISERIEETDSPSLTGGHTRLVRELLKGHEDPEAIEHLLAMVRVYETAYGAADVRVAKQESVAATIMLFHEEPERAAEHFLRALTIYRNTLPPEDSRVTSAETRLAIAIAAQSGRKPDEKSAGVVLIACNSQECTASGLKRGDWILSLGATKIRDEDHLLELMESTPAKRPVTLTLRRGGKQLSLQARGREGLQFSFTSWVATKP